MEEDRPVADERAEKIGPGTEGFCGGAFGAIHVEGEAEEDGIERAEVFLDGAGDSAEQGAALVVSPGDVEHGEGRGDAGEVVSDGQPGASFAEIDGEVSHAGGACVSARRRG